MATKRDNGNPYGVFNFKVTLGSAEAGFQEVSGLNVEMPVAEYRNGNDKVNYVRKVGGLYKVGDVTLKRGLMGATELYDWVQQTRTGDPKAPRQVVIELHDELNSAAVMTWTLTNARPMRFSAPSFNAKSSSDVAIEELVLACEDMTVS